MSRPQLLFLVHRVPFPPNRGDRIRSYHILRQLAERFDVSLATLADEPVSDNTRRELGRLCVQVAIERIGRWRWVRAAGSLALGRTATEGLFVSPALRRTIRRWATERRFDSALAFCSSMVQYLDCPELTGVPAVIDLVDVDSQKWFDYAAGASGIKRWLFELEGRRLRCLERSLPVRASSITLVSEAEARLYRSICPNDRTEALANGVDLAYFRPQASGPRPWLPLTDTECTDAVFVGALDYRANIDAVTWFAAEIWPVIRERLPSLTLGLVGRKPDPAVVRLSKVPGIRVFANVPDVRPYIAAAGFAIAPLRIARGIQNKVLEAMAMGKPVICSPAALEGLTAEPCRHLLVADQPAEWQSAIEELIVDHEWSTSLGMSARTFVERHHAWETTLAPLDQLVASPAAIPESDCSSSTVSTSPSQEFAATSQV